MIYEIKDNKILLSKLKQLNLEKYSNQLIILTNNEFQNAHLNLEQPINNFKYIKIDDYMNYLLGTLIINKQKDVSLYFYIINNNIIFVDDSTFTKDLIDEIIEKCQKQGYDIYKFLKDFLEKIIDKDLENLEKISSSLALLEETILKSNKDGINHRLMIKRKEIIKFYHYYSQLIDFGLTLQEKTNSTLYSVFIKRVERLQSETMLLREYTHQLQELYNSELNNRQNDIMKVLTIVTTIFLPLTLLTSWYGMNFKYMPEISWILGYPLFIILFAITFILCLIIFKIKKFW